MSLKKSLNNLLPSNFETSPDPAVCLRTCIERYLHGLEEVNVELTVALDGSEVYDAYVTCCLHLLMQNQQEQAKKILLAGDDKNLLMLSVFQNQQLNKLMEFVVCLGVYPLLSVGVSSPLHARMEHWDKFSCPRLNAAPERHARLFLIMNCFDALRQSSVETFRDLMSCNTFLGDFLAVLLQLSYGPVSRPSTETSQIIQDARKKLRRVLARLPRSVAFRELFLFQCGFVNHKIVNTSTNIRAPKWLQRACGRLITQLIIAKPCAESTRTTPLRDLILGVLDVIGGADADPRKIPAVATVLARILTTPPSTQIVISNSEDCISSYFLCLSMQIKNLLTDDGTSPSSSLVTQIGHLVAVNTIHEMFTRDSQLGTTLFLRPTLERLQSLLVAAETGTQKAASISDDRCEKHAIDASDACQLLSGEELRQLVHFISVLLDTQHPSTALLCLLLHYSQPWFHFFALLHATLDNGESDEADSLGQEDSRSSSLKNDLQSILVTMLSFQSDNVGAFSLLRGWLGLTAIDPASFEPIKTPTPPLALCRGVVLRPNLLVDSSSSSLGYPFRVCLIADLSAIDRLGLISAYVCAVMRLLIVVTPQSYENSSSTIEGEEKDEEVTQQLFSNWSGDNDHVCTTISLPSQILLSLILDINGHVCDQTNLHMLPNRDIILHTNDHLLDTGQHSPSTELLPVTASLLASSMLEGIDPGLLWPRNPHLAVRLFSMTLYRLGIMFDACLDDAVLRMQEESLSLILGMLAFYVNHMEKGEKVPSEVRDKFVELVPLLQTIETRLSKRAAASRELARQLRISLCTRGAVPCEEVCEALVNDSIPSPLQLPIRINATVEPLIEEISTIESGRAQKLLPDAEMHPKLASIFSLLRDVFIPVRGHGLIQLSRLLESNDPVLSGFEDKVYQVLVEQLADEDSYIYLNVIRGLSAMGNAFTDRLLPLLLEQFRTSAGSVGRVEFCLKIGEAIVRVLRELGEMASKYRDTVIATFLKTADNPDELVRAASLSNVAEICQLLRHAIYPVAYEVFSSIEDHLQYDISSGVRKSAAYAARSLTMLIGSSSSPSCFTLLPEDVLRDLHRLLSARATLERDPDVLEQIDAALGELSARTMSAIFPDEKKWPVDLVKEIRVLRPFND